MNDKKLDIIIITYNKKSLTFQCIESIIATAKDLVENIIVVDNNSNDGTTTDIKLKYPFVKTNELQQNFGYSYAVNTGVNCSDADYILVTNNDVIFENNSINELYTFLKKNPKTGACGPQQKYLDGSWEYSYGDLPSIKLGFKNIFFISLIKSNIKKYLWNRNYKSHPKIVSYLDGAVLMINKKAFTDVGGFDEDYYFYTEDADFCYKLKNNGWNVVFNPNSELIHIRGGSSAKMGLSQKHLDLFIKSKMIYCNKHLSKFDTNVYFFLEKTHNLIMYIIFIIIKKLSLGKVKDLASKKGNIFYNLYLAWKQNKITF